MIKNVEKRKIKVQNCQSLNVQFIKIRKNLEEKKYF